MAESSKELIRQDGKGNWRVGHGRAKYPTREAAERALFGYQTAIGISIKGEKRKTLTSVAEDEGLI